MKLGYLFLVFIIFVGCSENTLFTEDLADNQKMLNYTFTENEPFYSETESFEEGFGGWTSDHYLAPPKKLDWHIISSDEYSYNEEYSLEYYINGEHDDGTVWIEKSFAYSGESDVVEVTLEFYVAGSENNTSQVSQIVAHAGWRYDAEVENDFTFIDYPVNGEWQKYSYNTEISIYPRYEGRIWLALGINCITTVNQTYYFDYVHVELTESK